MGASPLPDVGEPIAIGVAWERGRTPYWALDVAVLPVGASDRTDACLHREQGRQ
jgi:hypothetical protein